MSASKQVRDFKRLFGLVEEIIAALQKKLEMLQCGMYIWLQNTEHGKQCRSTERTYQMAKTQDFNSAMKDIMGAFPVDTKAMDDAFKNQAALSEKLSGVALSAAEKSAEISSKWTKETLAKLNDITKAKAEPADYAKAFTDFASANAEVASENMAAFAEIAKKVQMETVELMMSAGKSMQDDATKAVKKAAEDVTAATQKATAAAK